MFLLLSKTLDAFAAPLTWVLALIAVAVWAVHRGHTAVASRCLASALVVLLIASNSCVATGLVGSLESSATTTVSPTTTYDAVVVLGGIVGASSTPEAPDFSEPVDRLLAGFDLVHTDRARSILVTSGPDEVTVLKRQLIDWGVDPDRIVVDDNSRNTHQNAVESAKIIRQRDWKHVVLVTSALHMTRAAGCFRAEGVAFDTLVVDHLSPAQSRPSQWLMPRADALNLTTVALREALGRVVYRIVGYAR